MGQFWSKSDVSSTSNIKKFSKHQMRKSQKYKTKSTKKILNYRKVSKHRPTISWPHQVNPVSLNGHKWRHVIVTMPSVDQPPLPPQRRKRKMKHTSVVQESDYKTMLPIQRGIRLEHCVNLFQTFISLGFATYLRTLRSSPLQLDGHALTNSIQSTDNKAIVEALWHLTAVRHSAMMPTGQRSQARFKVIRQKRRWRKVVPTVDTRHQTQPTALTKFWLKFKRKMRCDGKRVAGSKVETLAKKANSLCRLLKQMTLSQKNVETNTNVVEFHSSVAPFGLFTSHHLEPADSDHSMSESLSEFSCSL